MKKIYMLIVLVLVTLIIFFASKLFLKIYNKAFIMESYVPQIMRTAQVE